MKKNPLLSVRSAADLLGTTKWLLWHHSQDWGLTTYYTPGGGGQQRWSYQEVVALAKQWKERQEAEARAVLGLPEKAI